jgi:hypothetical protein
MQSYDRPSIPVQITTIDIYVCQYPRKDHYQRSQYRVVSIVKSKISNRGPLFGFRGDVEVNLPQNADVGLSCATNRCSLARLFGCINANRVKTLCWT